MSEKIKVLVIADHPFAPSGVGTQTKYIIEALLETNRYSFVCFGGAVKHENYTPQKVDPWGGDWIIHPVDGYGNQQMLRSAIQVERPDVLWFMTDPRFFPWLWDIENEIRSNIPMVYYHVWDNFPSPKYNKINYESTDVIACISKLTEQIVESVAPSVDRHYLPHAVDGEVFKKLSKQEVDKFLDENFSIAKDKKIFFWNNRNARRKQSGSVIYYFNEFAKKVGPDNVCLVMHTDVKDQHGQDLEKIIQDIDADDGRIVFTTGKYPSEVLAMMYNMAICTINISDAEGFGLATLESLSCGTPIIVNMTGGLQEQVTNGKEWFGIGLKPASKAVIGSQQVPYIYEDRVSQEEFIEALEKMYNMSDEERGALGTAGASHVQENYSFEKYRSSWVELMDKVHEKYGSWEDRKHYKPWELREIS
jgi:glycosyltransferase involved in cell wall biosynthesis